MKIVHFISHFPYPDQFTDACLTDRYVCSGGEAAAQYLVREQARVGNTVSVVTSSSVNFDQREKRNGYTVFRYGAWCKLGETLFSPGMFFRPIRDIDRPDIVHVHHTTPPGGMAGLVCNGAWKCPLVITHHGFEKPDSYGSLVRRAAVWLSAKYFVDILFRAASRIIYPSSAFFQTSRLLQKYQSKSHLIRHGYFPEEYHTDILMEQARRKLELPTNKRYGLFVGTLIPPKGLGVILEALPEVIKRYPELILLVLGRGPAEGIFRRQVTELGISENVRFVGFVGESERKLLYYRACDLLLIPSTLSEMYCFVLYEGAAAGCCIVTSDLEAFRMVITDHINGIITAAGDSRDVGKAVLEILGSKDLQLRLMSRAKDQIVPLTWPDISRQTCELYVSLLADHPLPETSASPGAG